MLKALEDTGQAEDTIVVFMSDHGELLGDHGIYLKGPYFYEGAINVPLMMSWPGHIPAQSNAGLVELV
ncbi:sulfatase-like hydrolase/transferase, partial [Mycobacterium tuberculosis]|nr:sulfatase-like hydrolase/transferase [Mycobacterium tuberculosis]